MESSRWEKFRNYGLLILLFALCIPIGAVPVIIKYGISNVHADVPVIGVFAAIVAIGAGFLYKAKRMLDEENEMMKQEG